MKKTILTLLFAISVITLFAQDNKQVQPPTTPVHTGIPYVEDPNAIYKFTFVGTLAQLEPFRITLAIGQQFVDRTDLKLSDRDLIKSKNYLDSIKNQYLIQSKIIRDKFVADSIAKSKTKH